jgi:acyl carrier protein
LARRYDAARTPTNTCQSERWGGELDLTRRHRILDRLSKVFRDVFDNTELRISENTRGDDIKKWDSITHIALVLSFEDEFDLTLTVSEISDLDNVGAFVDIVEQRGGV